MTDYMLTTAGRPYDEIIKLHGRDELYSPENSADFAVLILLIKFAFWAPS